MDSAEQFQWYDYFLFAATLAISLSIGVFFALTGGKQKTTGEYLMANRSLGILPVALSIFMSNTSAILLLGNTAEMYTFGVQAWFSCIAYTISYCLGAAIFTPMFYPLRLTSVFEYLERRYASRAVRLVGTILFLISAVMYMGLAMYSPSTALAAVTPIPIWASVVTMGVIGTLYTAMGGMKAVVWSDVFQAVVMIGGVVAILIMGMQKVGGLSNAWQECVDGGRIWVTFNPNPVIRLSMWPVLVGNSFSALSMVATSQTSVQRLSAMASMRKAQMACLVNIPLDLIMYTITYLCGAAMFAYYHMQGCDVYRTGQIDNSNQILPYFVVNALKVPAFPGLFVAILFSGALSSISSSMNSCAAVVWEDFLKNKYGKLKESKKAVVTKLLALIFGALAVAVSFIYQYLPGNVQVIARTINSSALAPILGMFIVAAWFPCSTAKGNIIGAIFGFLMTFTVSIGNSISRPWPATLNSTVSQCSENVTINDNLLEYPEDVFPLFGMSYMWYSSLGALTTIVVGVAASFITGSADPSEVDPRYVTPVFSRLLCCLPTTWLSKTWCGVPYDTFKRGSAGNLTGEQQERSDDGGASNVDDKVPSDDCSSGKYSSRTGLASGSKEISLADGGGVVGAQQEVEDTAM